MINRIAFVANRREDFTFRRRNVYPGYILVNKNDQIAIVRPGARICRSLVFGTLIAAESSGSPNDKVFSAMESHNVRFESKDFLHCLNTVKSRSKPHVPRPDQLRKRSFEAESGEHPFS